MATLSMNDIVRIIINLSPRATVRKAFNLALIIGESDVISVDDRINEFSSVSDMESAGFSSDSDEYKAARIFFAANSSPTRLLVGRWDSSNEDLEDAVKICRERNSEWYVLLPLVEGDTRISNLSEWVETATPSTVMACVTDDLSVVGGFKGLLRKRTICVVSEQQFTHVAVMGYAMGMQTNLRNSAYTLFGKALPGIETDDWTTTEIKEIQSVNGNYYVNRGNTYNMFEQGVMCDGTWFDERINLDKLANDLQLALMDVFTSSPKVPQTDGGIERLRIAMIDPLQNMVTTGFIAPGVWTGPNVMALNTGDMLSAGYLIQNESIAEQSAEQRDNRIAPPFYIAIKLAGATHSVIVQVNVNR